MSRSITGVNAEYCAAENRGTGVVGMTFIPRANLGDVFAGELESE